MFSLLVTLILVHYASSFSPSFLPCQLQKAGGVSPLQGCPDGTLFVSQTEPTAQFKSVQEAVLSLPPTGPSIILIGEGEYHETVNVTRKDPVTFLGQLRGTRSTQNLVQIWDNQFVKTGMDDAQSAVLLVAPSFNASLIGAGPTGAPLQPLFGNTDFKAYNIDFQNRATRDMELACSHTTHTFRAELRINQRRIRGV
ncbi:hypothetical protein C8Q75DRAFT_776116 [Abortiporus biennis]|nr:hypothetical protein C8Q75DRAFT_776116 [Abortiporus biennis]